MADEASGRNLEPLARSTTGHSVHGSQDRDGADLASPSAANRQTRCSGRAARFEKPATACVSGRIQSRTGLQFVVSAARRDTKRDPERNWMAGSYRARLYLAHS